MIFACHLVIWLAATPVYNGPVRRARDQIDFGEWPYRNLSLLYGLELALNESDCI